MLSPRVMVQPASVADCARAGAGAADRSISRRTDMERGMRLPLGGGALRPVDARGGQHAGKVSRLGLEWMRQPAPASRLAPGPGGLGAVTRRSDIVCDPRGNPRKIGGGLRQPLPGLTFIR